MRALRVAKGLSREDSRGQLRLGPDIHQRSRARAGATSASKISRLWRKRSEWASLNSSRTKMSLADLEIAAVYTRSIESKRLQSTRHHSSWAYRWAHKGRDAGFAGFPFFYQRPVMLKEHSPDWNLFLMPANFSSMVGEFIVASIPKYCPTVMKKYITITDTRIYFQRDVSGRLSTSCARGNRSERFSP